MSPGPPLGQERLYPKDIASHFRISARSARRWLAELECAPGGHQIVGRVGTGEKKGQRYTTLAALARVQPIGGPTHRELHDRVTFLEDELSRAMETLADFGRRLGRIGR